MQVTLTALFHAATVNIHFVRSTKEGGFYNLPVLARGQSALTDYDAEFGVSSLRKRFNAGHAKLIDFILWRK